MSAKPSRPDTDRGATAALPVTRSSGRAPAGRRPRRRLPRARIPVGAGVAGLAVLILAALYLAGYQAAGDKLPRNAQISGVVVGGLSQAQATDKLVAELGPRAAQPLVVSAEDRTATLAPADAGLRIDYAKSVAAAGGGKSYDPRQILTVLTGGSNTDVVAAVDENSLRTAVQTLATSFDRAPVDATLAYAGTDIKQTPGVPGLSVRQAPAAVAIQNGFLRTTEAIPLPLESTAPEITDDEVGDVVESFAKPAVSAPVQVSVGGDKSFALTPAMIARAITFPAQDGTLAPAVDAKILRGEADPAVQQVVRTKPKDATVRLVDGQPKVIAAEDGAAVGADQLVEAVQPVLAKSGAARTATVKLTPVKASFTADDAAKLGVKEVTGRFTTYFSYAAYRNTNITKMADKINDTLVKPGETFSLNKVVGERTKAGGFVDGQVIDGSRAKRKLGGEESQSAVTTFNAMFFAGLQDVQHRPHSVYLTRFPAGREANVDGSKLDLRFRNDTKSGVLVQAFVVAATADRRGSITVKIWSTKTYDEVRASPTVRSNVTAGRSVRDGSSGCLPMSAAPGFDADYERRFYRNDAIVKRQKFHWHYAATNQVTCD